jgi:hypothetical protein
MAVHARHHELRNNVTAYGTAFGEALDYGLCICLFHFLVYLYLRKSASWNPVALAAAFFAEVRSSPADQALAYAEKHTDKQISQCYLIKQVSTDISGHCGYEGNVCLSRQPRLLSSVCLAEQLPAALTVPGWLNAGITLGVGTVTPGDAAIPPLACAVAPIPGVWSTVSSWRRFCKQQAALHPPP